MSNKPSVLLISIDALKPEFVFESERIGVNLPNLKKIFRREWDLCIKRC